MMKAVVVAAGRGKRLIPLTDDSPKSLLPVRGIPVLTYLLRGLRWSGISEVVIVIGYLGDRIRDTYGDGSDLGMKLDYAWQTGPNGTGSALLAAEEHLDNEPFMLLWGDVLMEAENYRRIRDAYPAHPSHLLSGLNRLDDLTTGAAVQVDADRIISIEEKPPPGTTLTNWNQAGLFVCTRHVFTSMRECGLSPRGEIEFTSGVERLISCGKDVRWMPVKGFWSDVGTPQLLAQLNANPAVDALLR